MNKLFIVREKNSDLVHAIITEQMVEFFKKNFTIYDIVEIASIGFSNGTTIVDGKKISINTFSCYKPLKIDSVGHMIRSWASDNSYAEVANSLKITPKNQGVL